MYVQLNDTRLFVDVDGPGLVPSGGRMRLRPTVVLVHGGPGFEHSGFKPEFSRLRDVAQVVYFDQRGHGRSDRGNAPQWTLDVWADDIRELCDALGVERPIVYGHSWGGVVAMTYASRYPDHPGGLIVQSSTARFDLERTIEGFRRAGGDVAADVFRRYWGEHDRSARSEFATHCVPVYGPWTPDPDHMTRLAINPDILLSAPTHFAGLDIRERLAHIRCPTRVIAGELDPLHGPDDAHEIAESLPPDLPRVEILESAGHFAWRDAPETFWPLVTSFLEEYAPAQVDRDAKT